MDLRDVSWHSIKIIWQINFLLENCKLQGKQLLLWKNAISAIKPNECYLQPQHPSVPSKEITATSRGSIH